MCRIVLALILLSAFGLSRSYGQTIERNADKELIVTYKDGSWRYFMPTDSLILQKEYQTFLASELPERGNQSTEIAPVDTVSSDTSRDTTDEDAGREVVLTEEEELRILALTERRLMLTERLRRVESGYIQLDEKELRKANEELAAINLELARMTMKEESDVKEEIDSEVKGQDAYNRNQYLFEPVQPSEEKMSCQVRQVTDELTGDKKYFTEAELLFQYTPVEARPVLGPEHYLEAWASVFKNGDQLILTLEFKIRSEGQHSGFGSLNESSRLKLTTMDGSTLTLYNGVEDKGRRDAVERIFVYKGHYLLDEDAVKILSKEDLDTVRVNWSAGYQDYEIYLIDVLRNQLNCLKREIENK